VPFLRVIRDKRGYETTYLMHWCREGSKQRSRILYVFRTPGGVRVGREALESDVLKEIEAQHPDIEFDWNAVFHNQQVIETAPEPRRPRKRPQAEGAEAAPVQPAGAVPPPRFTVPAAIEGATPDEQIAFLAKWYATLREKIPQRAPDPARQEVLLALCERLNPAAWSDADQITAGLQGAAEALPRLSHVFAKRRRRTKKRKPESSEAVKASEPKESAAIEPPEPTEPTAPTAPTEPSEPPEPPEPQ
jgi:hypothetical protein